MLSWLQSCHPIILVHTFHTRTRAAVDVKLIFHLKNFNSNLLFVVMLDAVVMLFIVMTIVTTFDPFFWSNNVRLVSKPDLFVLSFARMLGWCCQSVFQSLH